MCQKLRIEQINLPTVRALGTTVGLHPGRRITRIVRVTMDIDGWTSEAAFYVVPGLAHDVILGFP